MYDILLEMTLPDLRSNIISLGQATEAGCDVCMNKNFLMLYDKDGIKVVSESKKIEESTLQNRTRSGGCKVLASSCFKHV